MIVIEDDECVKQVFSHVKAKSTKNGYTVYLYRYVNEFLGGKHTVEDLVAEAKADVQKTQQSFDKFYEWLQKEKGLKEYSAYIATFGYLRGFFVNADVQFQRKWAKSHGKVQHLKEAIRSDTKYDFFPLDERTKTVSFNRELFQKFLSNLKLRDQAIALCMLSSSQDSIDLFKLNIGDFDDKTNHRFFWQGTRAKTGVLFRTFFSKEATKYVKRYLEQERRGAKDEEPLFTQADGVKRMEGRYLSMIFKAAAERMGIKAERVRDQCVLRPKRMRHLFRTACDDLAGLQELFVNIFMGHKNDQGQDYSEISKSKLELEYMKVEPFLQVYGETEELTQTREDITKLQATIEVLQKRMGRYEAFVQKFMSMSPKELSEIGQAVLEKRVKKEQEEILETETEKS